LPQRVVRLVEQAVAAGRFESEAAIMEAAGLSPSYIGELRIRAKKNPKAGLKQRTVEALARALGITAAQLVGDVDEPALVDVHPNRAFAVEAARKLQLPEAAIQVVLREQRNDDPSRIFWFRRIEAEAERLRPSTDLPRRDR
jgi:transcriptional regulator with XRE-family HTH domain